MPIDSNVRRIIKKNGHITIDDMMREVLSNNKQSYYKSTKSIGKDGDFITSPEISQLFGEIIALWAIEKWQALGSPDKFALVELGPGQGKLMQDFLRVAKLDNKFYSAINLFLCEINPFFIEKQKEKLSQHNLNISWIKTIQEIPDIPAIIIANEFFDALPVKQYLKVKNKWYESILVSDPIDGRLKFHKMEISKLLQKQLSFDHKKANDGAVIEESIESLDIIRHIGKRLNKNKGAVLVIDYGYHLPFKIRTMYQYNSTLQAIKDHQYSSVLDTLGEADLTTHVDFNALVKTAKQQEIQDINFSTQEEFLVKYGINLRLSSLKSNLSNANFINVAKQVFRLTSAKQMGELFKVLELFKI